MGRPTLGRLCADLCAGLCADRTFDVCDVRGPRAARPLKEALCGRCAVRVCFEGPGNRRQASPITVGLDVRRGVGEF